ncbi:T9SS type A sorting domain-containing protein [Aquimarina muelleri]|uniref:T9SS type A sorting domain-containing protein n=1 Tax=Aquimarina muelleri TaxID=279356 RepID=UPI003F685C2F
MKKLLRIGLLFLLGNQLFFAQADHIKWEFRGGKILSNPSVTGPTYPGVEPAGLYGPGGATKIPTSDQRLPSAILVDLDNDKDLDFISGSQRGSIHYFENTGSITAPHWVLASIPTLDTIKIDINNTVRNQNRPQLADIDNDGDLDLFIGTDRNYEGLGNDNVRFYRNIGSPEVPVFEYIPACIPGLLDQDIAEFPGLGFVDLDNDTDLDLVALGSDKLTYYKNIGTKENPNFERQSEANSPWDDESAYINMDVPIPVFEDFDKDGDYDMYFMTDDGFVRWLENDGTATNPHFATPQQTMHSQLTSADMGTYSTVDFGDVNGDGLKDAILANFNDPRFAWFRQVPECIAPTISNITATPVLCEGETSTITITGNLNIASTWSIYTDSCGGTLIGTTTTNTSTFVVTPTAPKTTYYIRGEDGDISCIDESTATCTSITITVNAIENPSFSYDTVLYCKDATNPTPNITGVAGGIFSSTTGLSIAPNTGTIDIATSTSGNYIVTYTSSGICPSSSTAMIEIKEVEDSGFYYDAVVYCKDATNPTPTITGVAGGIFSSTTGLSIDPNTGTIDIATSTSGNYIVTYTTTGSCTSSSTAEININALSEATLTRNSLILTANVDKATYQWINCETNTPIAGETNQSFTATTNGSYAVDITLNSCTKRSTCILIDSIMIPQEDTLSSFKLYPNPTDGIVNISMPIQKISIFNYYGRKILETSNSTFDISPLRSGIYFIEIETTKGRTIKKIVRL